LCIVYQKLRKKKRRTRLTIHETAKTFIETVSGEDSLSLPESPLCIGHFVSDEGDLNNDPKTDVLEMQTYNTPEGEPSFMTPGNITLENITPGFC